MQTYIDAMDPTRFLRPEGDEGNAFKCRVYFKEGSEPAQFAGKVTLPKVMFSTSTPIESMSEVARMHQDDRCGFILVNTLSAPKVAAQQEQDYED